MKLEAIFDVRGQVSLVTGAASGLGLSISEAMADNGAHVVMTDIDQASLDAHVARLKDRGCSVEGVQLDIGDLDRLRAVIDDTASRHGRLDSVFANAGITSGPGFRFPDWRLEVYPSDVWEKVLHVNLTSIFVTLQTASAHMKRQGGGRIIVTASIAGLRAETNVGYGYVATKAAIVNVVRQAAMELATHKVSVNAIAPGPFLTNIAGGRLHREPEVAKEFAEMVPQQRLADPSEIQGLALLLASPASSYITGAVIPIDGGVTAR
ncbi:MAG: SDR family NAD(P)-dependent oxidoreductase [Caulobacteraceae bacterium]